MRLSLAQNKFDGYVINRFAGLKDPNDADSVAGRIQFAIAPSDSVDVSVNLHFAEEDSVDGSWQQPTGALGDIGTPLPANVDF